MKKIAILFIVAFFVSSNLYAQDYYDADKNNSVESLRISIRRKNIVIEKLISEKDFLKEELLNVSEHKTRLENEIFNLQRKIIEIDETAFDADSVVEDLKLQKEALLQQLMNARQEKVFLSQDLENTKDKLKDSELEFQTRLTAEISPLEEKIKNLNNTIVELNGSIRRKDAIMHNLEKDSDELKKEVEWLRQEKSKLNEKISILNENIKIIENNSAIKEYFNVSNFDELFSYAQKEEKYAIRTVWCLMQFGIWKNLFMEHREVKPSDEENPLDWI